MKKLWQTSVDLDSAVEAYTVGEKLIYEAKFSKAVFRGIAVADSADVRW